MTDEENKEKTKSERIAECAVYIGSTIGQLGAAVHTIPFSLENDELPWTMRRALIYAEHKLKMAMAAIEPLFAETFEEWKKNPPLGEDFIEYYESLKEGKKEDDETNGHDEDI